MLTMVFLSAGITGAVYFLHTYEIFPKQNGICKNVYDSNKLQNLPCKNTIYPKISWHREREQVLATSLGFLVSKALERAPELTRHL